MMREPLTSHGRRETALSFVLKPPTGGWNTRDTIADMREGDAILLDNFFPRPGDVTMRKGAEDHTTGFIAPVKALHTYKGVNGTAKLFASCDNGMFDATTVGAVGATVHALTNGNVHSTQNATSAGNYLMCVNGTDELALYDGTTWASINGASVPAITGVATTALSNILLWKKRALFLRNQSRSFYYLPVDSVGGALTEYPCGAYLRKGGYLTGFGSWTVDAGEGADDHLALASSEGQILLFQGIDPSTPASWKLVGTFDLGPPLGTRCFVQFGGDLIYLGTNGIFSMAKSLATANFSDRVPFSDKIVGAVQTAASVGGSLSGWCGAVLRKENALLINVPQVDASSHQYVMNTQTGAWCRFIGLTGTCMTVLNEVLYIGTTTKVFKALTGSTDFGGDISGESMMAYNYFGAKGRKKQPKQARPIITASATVAVSMAVSSDFEDDGVYASSPGTAAAGSVWDTAVWDAATWGGSTAVTKNWLHVPAKVGYCHAFKLRLSSRASNLSWTALNVLARAAAVGM